MRTLRVPPLKRPLIHCSVKQLRPVMQLTQKGLTHECSWLWISMPATREKPARSMLARDWQVLPVGLWLPTVAFSPIQESHGKGLQ